MKESCKRKIRQTLSRREVHTISDNNFFPSAVLLPIYRNGDEYYLVFTKRTQNLKNHKGQVSFPGGAFEGGNDRNLADTALRESFEEIGLRGKDVEILGKLDETTTVSHFIISPFIGAIPYPYEFNLSHSEVDELLRVPISTLINESNPSEQFAIGNGECLPVYTYRYKNHLIWGATARILRQFLQLFFQV
jgi:8-oxo-dGTP pyrophosphatase MutT (NUDIX family)